MPESELGTMEVRLVGEGIEPGLVRSRELAEIIEAVEDMVASVAAKADPTLLKDDIVVGLSGLDAGSLRLRFGSPQPSQVAAAFAVVTAAVSGGHFGDLPNQSLRSLERISAFSKRHDAVAEFYATQGGQPGAVVTPTLAIPQPSLVAGETVLYGEVIRVGGRRPRVMVETVAGETVYCVATPAVAKQLAGRLYESAKLIGRAVWDPDDWSLEEFRIEQAAPGVGESNSSVIAALAAVVGEYYQDVSDPIGHVAKLRSGELD